MIDKINFDRVFKNYAPPEGGVHGLREKLDKVERKSSLFSIPKITVASAIAVVIIISVLITPKLLKPRNNLFIELVNKSDNPALIKYGYVKRGSEAVTIPADARSHLAALRVETSNEKVKFYLIESTM